MFIQTRLTVSTFAESLRGILEKAHKEADRLRHNYLGTEHLLLGALHDSTIKVILSRLRIPPENLRSMIEAKVQPGRDSLPSESLPYSSRAKIALEHATKEAKAARQQFPKPEHLLLGLFYPKQSIAAEVLRRSGVTPEEVRQAAEFLLNGGSKTSRFQIDDNSELSIYEQIIAHVTEAVATRDLLPAERLPSVRQLADQLDIAPGTVARAYRELERRNLIVTDGARGTSIASNPVSATKDSELTATLAGLLRPVAVAAFHMRAGPADLRKALEESMRGIFDKQDHDPANSGTNRPESLSE